MTLSPGSAKDQAPLLAVADLAEERLFSQVFLHLDVGAMDVDAVVGHVFKAAVLQLTSPLQPRKCVASARVAMVRSSVEVTMNPFRWMFSLRSAMSAMPPAA